MHLVTIIMFFLFFHTSLRFSEVGYSLFSGGGKFVTKILGSRIQTFLIHDRDSSFIDARIFVTGSFGGRIFDVRKLGLRLFNQFSN